VTIPEIKTVLYVGAGTMGCYNSLAAAVSGYQVVLYDVSADTLAQVPGRHQEFVAMLVGGGYCTPEAASEALTRVTVTDDLKQAAADADLVSESVFERIDVKRDIHRQLDEICPPHTILTTNSSALPVSAIEDVVMRGERFAALHSHLGSPLVDIVGGPRTAPGIIELLERYVLSTRGVPLVLKKEHPGYVLNAILGPVMSTAMLLLIKGVATVEEVDSSWMRWHEAAIGPFGMMDLFGLKLIYDSWQYREEDAVNGAQRQGILGLLGPMLERGELGQKSGSGFYRYPQPRYQQADFLESTVENKRATDALLVAQVANALVVAGCDVAAPADIDRAWKAGTYLATGPFATLEQLGVGAFRQLLQALVDQGYIDAARARAATTYLDSRAANGQQQ
jgi:3-hydroxybutyryl-CoA dehydrogenase